MAVGVFVVSFILVSPFIPLGYLIVPPKTPVLSGFEPAAIGSNRDLVCDASQPDAGTITYKWYKYSIVNGVENWEPKGPIGTSQNYIFNPVTEKKVFHLFSNADTVSGKYKCRASNSAGTRDSEWGDLYVYTPCSLYTVSVSPPKPAIGSTFTLNCNIHNPSGLTVRWLKRAGALSPAVDVATANKLGCHAPSNPRYSWRYCSPPSIFSPTKTFNLQVTNAQPSDSGYWICKDIGLSCDSDPIKPVVQAHPVTPQITGFPSGPVIAGTQLNLKCVASPPGDTYDWYKDGTKVTTSSSYDFQVTKDSAGVYKCVARNDVGSAPSSDKTLVVYYKPDSVVVSSGKTSSYVGEKDKFTCTVSGGNPTPTVKLYFKRSGGTPVEVTQGQDRVMAKEDNQAEYYCVAKVTGYPAFEMTSSRKTYSVTFSNTKVSFLSIPTAVVQAGQVKKFTCETDESNPVTDIKWYQHITGSSWQDVTTGISSSERNGVYGGKIRISEWSVTATKAMNGETVRCASIYSLTGHVFTTNTDTTMYVKFRPSKITIPKRPPAAIHEEKPIMIICETDSANPVVNIQFHRKRAGGIWEQLTSGITSQTRRTSQAYTPRNRQPSTNQCHLVSPKSQDGNWGKLHPAEENGTYTLSKGSVGTPDYGNYIVIVTNSVGMSSFVFELLRRAAPNAPTIKITRNGRLVTVVFGAPIREYTGFQLKFCGPGQAPKTTGCSAIRFINQGPTKSTYTVSVTNETTIYVFYMDFYVGDDVVYSSGQVHPKQAVPAGSSPDGGMIAGVVVAVVIVVAVVVVVVVLHRRNMACFADLVHFTST
ncbi:uncharacterized protein LOC135497195 [Lineus longissimus]|uniref:uncharacterized protein LOC135497195 n=1 Tax=Lineus longissimus TaxID=88925 RepID=UPI00315DC31F